MYPLLMIFSVGVAWLLLRAPARALKLPRADRAALGLGAFCGAMIGAKLPYVLTDWAGMLSGSAWFDPGKTILGGLAGGYLGVEIAKAARGIMIKTGDRWAVPVAAAVAVGRLACFVAGCCHGKPTALPWGVDFGDGLHRHPTQLYESAFHATLALLLWHMEKRDLLKNQRLKFYILIYLAYRFVSEWIRPEPVFALGLTVYQWAALALAPVFLWLWHVDARMALSTRSGLQVATKPVE